MESLASKPYTDNPKTILVIGDVMLDVFCYGRVKRLNPESPAPLILIEHEEYKLGGAANVAANIISLGGRAVLTGKIGADKNGEKLRHLCLAGALPFEALISETEPTITKERVIETTYHQQLIRIDYERIGQIGQDNVHQIESLIISTRPDIIVVSDYQKGLITEDIARVIMNSWAQILGDLKPGNLSWFHGAYVIKPNFKEFREQVGIVWENTDSFIETHGPWAARLLDTNLVITRSEHGVSVVMKDGTVHHMPTLAQDIFDVTGAGDTFIAAMAVALSEGKTLLEAAEFGNQASAVAVGQVGTATVERASLR